jgi:hypothetical protein
MAGVSVIDGWRGRLSKPKGSTSFAAMRHLLGGSTPAVAQMWKLRDAAREGAEPSTTLATPMTSLVYAVSMHRPH